MRQFSGENCVKFDTYFLTDFYSAETDAISQQDRFCFAKRDMKTNWPLTGERAAFRVGRASVINEIVVPSLETASSGQWARLNFGILSSDLIACGRIARSEELGVRRGLRRVARWRGAFVDADVALQTPRCSDGEQKGDEQRWKTIHR